MKPIAQLVATTILGGIVFLTPLVVIGAVVGKAFDFARRSLQPLAAFLPDRLASAPTLSAALAIVALGLVCFLAGGAAQTPWAKRLVGRLEESVLSFVPGYQVFKQAETSLLGVGQTADNPLVLAEFGGSWRIGVQTDETEGGLLAVFVPNAPNPMSGAVFLLPSDKVRRLDAPLAAAIGSLRRCGSGVAGVVGASPPAS